MSGGDHFDPSSQTALVLDDNHYERGISLDQLRAMGFGRAIGAANTMEAWESLRFSNPHVVLMEWIDGSGGDGLDFARRVRKPAHRGIARSLIAAVAQQMTPANVQMQVRQQCNADVRHGIKVTTGRSGCGARQ